MQNEITEARVPDHVWATFLKEYDDEIDLRPREGNEAMYRALSAALAAADEQVPVAWTLGYMPTYGKASWIELRQAVAEATTGHRPSRSEFTHGDTFIGHEIVPQINFNSLNRIVSAFALFARPTPPCDGRAEALEDQLESAASLLEVVSEDLAEDDTWGIMMSVMAKNIRAFTQKDKAHE